MMTINKTLAAALVSVAAMGTANASSLALDTFDYSFKVEAALPGTPTDNAQINNFNVFGGDVQYNLEILSGGVDANAQTFAGGLFYENGTTAVSELTITYGQFDGFGLPTLDFTGFDAFYFDILAVDLGFDFSVSVTDSDSNSATFTSTTSQIIASTVNTVSFSNFAGVDFSAVDEVKLEFAAATNPATGNPFTALDLALGEFGVVPEPATLAVFGLGLLGLGAARRRKA